MITLEESVRPRASSRPRSATAAFVALAFGMTSLFLLPAVLALRGLVSGPPARFLVLAALGGTFSPLIAAVLISAFEANGEGARAFFRRACAWRTGAGWSLVALVLFGAIYFVGASLFALVGGAGASCFYPPAGAQDLAAMVVVPLAEGPAWRGLALPRLEQRYGARAASLLLGLAWSLHLTLKQLVLGTIEFPPSGLSPAVLAVSIANVVASSVVFSWLFKRTRGSVPVAILAQMGIYLNNPYRALPENITPLVVDTAALAIVSSAMFFELKGRASSRAVPAD